MYQIRLCAQGAEGDSLAQVLAALDLAKERLMEGSQGGNGQVGTVTFEFEVREVDAEHRHIIEAERSADPIARLMRDPAQADLLGLLAKEAPGGITRIKTSAYFEYENDGETYVLLDPERRKLEEQLGEALLERVYPGYPDGHPKLLHLWPPKLLQAGRINYGQSEGMTSRAAASLSR